MSDDNFDQLFSHANKIALAVSGGPDSIAMMHMIHQWALASKKEITILTVNHNLRTEAQEESDFVKKFSAELGIKYILLEWVHDGVTSNVHDRAREARYELMTNWCKNNNIDTLCTAHHMDDRVENFFIRVSKGAGILGLIDRQEIIYNGIHVIRPVFEYSKATLLEYLVNHNLQYCADKSNEDPKYLRTNIRQWLELLPTEIDRDLFRQRVIGVKENLLRTSEVIERIFEEELQSKAIIHKDYATLSAMPQDKEIAYMTLSRLITLIGDTKAARLDSIQLLYNNLISENPTKSTLGGCVIESKNGEIMFTKEVGRKKSSTHS
jgi:tRNA(Ile)-lysidine synthase